MNTLLKSSVNPEKLSLTVKGFIPLILLLAGIFQLNLTSLDVNTFVDTLVKVLAEVGVAITGLITLYGLGRKIIVGLKRNGNGQTP